MIALVLSLIAPLPSVDDSTIYLCHMRAEIRASFAEARDQGADRRDLRKYLIDIANDKNIDEDPENDVPISQLKTVIDDLNWAYDHPDLTPSQAFDAVYEACKEENKTVVGNWA